MKRHILLLLLCSLLPTVLSAREVFPLNEGWRFFFKSERTSDNARHITLPHSWNTDPLAQGYWLETTGSPTSSSTAATSGPTAEVARPSRSKSRTRSASARTMPCS